MGSNWFHQDHWPAMMENEKGPPGTEEKSQKLGAEMSSRLPDKLHDFCTSCTTRCHCISRTPSKEHPRRTSVMYRIWDCLIMDPVQCLCTCITRRLVVSLRRSIVLGMLYFLLILSFMSTVGFWTVLSDVTSGNHLETQLKGDKADTKRQLRSLRDWMEFPEIDLDQFNAADLFAIRPADEDSEEHAHADDAPLEDKTGFGLLQGHGACIRRNASAVCPEFDTPDLIAERKVNLTDVPMAEVEQILLGDRLKDVKRLVNHTNHLINKARLITGNSSSSEFVSCEKATTSRDDCGNKNFKSALESNRILTDNNYVYTPGGIWTPTDCLPRWKVAIIIPYRNRSFHLPIVIRFLTPMLQRQKLEFGFYVAEQANNLNFNRAMLMNIGFVEALNFSKWDCFIFHDVDHIPLSDYNYYGCSGMPRHFLSGADRWKYKLPYQDFFGAVTGLSRGQIYQINGFPNVYWGWGGEDDEILSRVRDAGLEISRIKGPKGYHNVIKHHHQSAPVMKERFSLLKNFRPRLKKDGLNNLEYKKPEVTLHMLYTNISVNIQKLKVDVPPIKAQAKPNRRAAQPRRPVKPAAPKAKAQPQPVVNAKAASAGNKSASAAVKAPVKAPGNLSVSDILELHKEVEAQKKKGGKVDPKLVQLMKDVHHGLGTQKAKKADTQKKEPVEDPKQKAARSQMRPPDYEAGDKEQAEQKAMPRVGIAKLEPQKEKADDKTGGNGAEVNDDKKSKR